MSDLISWKALGLGKPFEVVTVRRDGGFLIGYDVTETKAHIYDEITKKHTAIDSAEHPQLLELAIEKTLNDRRALRE